MFNPNDEIRGKHLQALDNQLQSEIQRFTERQESESFAAQNRKQNHALKSMATLIVTQIVGK